MTAADTAAKAPSPILIDPAQRVEWITQAWPDKERIANLIVDWLYSNSRNCPPYAVAPVWGLLVRLGIKIEQAENPEQCVKAFLTVMNYLACPEPGWESVEIKVRTSNDAFLEIQEQHGISHDLETTNLAMHRLIMGKNRVITFYGVGEPIPPGVASKIRASVIPLLMFEETPGYENHYTISNEVLKVGEPARRQGAWNAFCAESAAGT